MKILAGFNDKEFYELVKNAVKGKHTIVENIKSGNSLLQYVLSEKVDLLLLGDSFSDMTVYEFISKLMNENPIPCLIIFKEGQEKVEIDFPRSLEYGIVVTIEVSIVDNEIRYPDRLDVRINVLRKLRVAKFQSQIEQINRGKSRIIYHDPDLRDKIQKIRASTSMKRIRSNVEKSTPIEPISGKPKQVIVIGASTGGPKTLMYIISQFPSDFPPVLVVQHMPKGFVGSFAERMNTNANMKVVLGKNGDVLKNGTVYIAPGGQHMELDGNAPSNARISITDGAKVNFVKPSVDVTLYAAVRIFEDKVISVILTGMGADGRDGTRVVKKMGGRSIALNEEQSIIYGMNKAVIDAGLADEILGMDQIVVTLARWVKE